MVLDWPNRRVLLSSIIVRGFGQGRRLVKIAALSRPTGWCSPCMPFAADTSTCWLTLIERRGLLILCENR